MTYTVTLEKTVGLYGKDEQGNPWATFQIINGEVSCSVCGASIDRGWQRGRLGEVNLVVCGSHVQIQTGETR